MASEEGPESLSQCSIVFKAWAATTQLKRADRDIKSVKQTQRKLQKKEILDGIELAASKNESHKVWRLVRQLTYKKVGPKKRLNSAALPDPLTLQEWVQHNQKPPDKGGMSARVVDKNEKGEKQIEGSKWWNYAEARARNFIDWLRRYFKKGAQKKSCSARGRPLRNLVTFNCRGRQVWQC